MHDYYLIYCDSIISVSLRTSAFSSVLRLYRCVPHSCVPSYYGACSWGNHALLTLPRSRNAQGHKQSTGNLGGGALWTGAVFSGPMKPFIQTRMPWSLFPSGSTPFYCSKTAGRTCLQLKEIETGIEEGQLRITPSLALTCFLYLSLCHPLDHIFLQYVGNDRPKFKWKDYVVPAWVGAFLCVWAMGVAYVRACNQRP